jgi:hypothetical protein
MECRTGGDKFVQKHDISVIAANQGATRAKKEVQPESVWKKSAANPQATPLFGRGCASSALSWQAVPANKDANAGRACVDSGGQGRTLSEQGEPRRMHEEPRRIINYEL